MTSKLKLCIVDVGSDSPGDRLDVYGFEQHAMGCGAYSSGYQGGGLFVLGTYGGINFDKLQSWNQRPVKVVTGPRDDISFEEAVEIAADYKT